MKKHLFGTALVLCLVMTSGVAIAQYTAIDDLQIYDAVTGAPASPYDGQTVTVRGVVVEVGRYSGGSFHIIDSTGAGLAGYNGSGAPPIDFGDDVEVTGVIGQFGGMIQIGTPTFNVLSSDNVLVPEEKTITEVLSSYTNVGRFGSVIGTITSIEGDSRFYYADAGDTMQVYIDSSTGILLGGYSVGDLVQCISPIVVFSGEIEMKPMFQGDIILNPGGDLLPVIDNINNSNWTPEFSQNFDITADIVDDSAVVSATVYYRVSDGVSPGAWNAVSMSNVGGDTYSGTITSGFNQRLVEYYLEATDDGAQTVASPGDAPASYFTVAVGFTKIWDMQYAHPDSSSQSAALDGEYVNIKGIVTVGTGAGGTGISSQIIVQEPLPNFDTGDFKFAGVLIYESTGSMGYLGTPGIYAGDEVWIGGLCSEYFGLTELLPHNADAVTVMNFGQELPPASGVKTRTLADDSTADIDGDGIMGEAWESVWVQTYSAAVVDTLGFGEYLVADTGARVDSLVIDPATTLTYQPILGDVLKITGYMDYAFSARRLVPLADEYIIQTGASPVDDTPTVISAGGFRSIAPNPFNPMTKIKFAVNKDNLVQLNVYNIRGEKVRTIVNDVIPANEYTFEFDGKDDGGQTLASGTYFARLRIGKEVMQVRPMTLVK